jgi:hypothetical protein
MEAGKYIYICICMWKVNEKIGWKYIQVLRKREINPLKEYFTNTIFS